MGSCCRCQQGAHERKLAIPNVQAFSVSIADHLVPRTRARTCSYSKSPARTILTGMLIFAVSIRAGQLPERGCVSSRDGRQRLCRRSHFGRKDGSRRICYSPSRKTYDQVSYVPHRSRIIAYMSGRSIPHLSRRCRIRNSVISRPTSILHRLVS